MNPELKKTLSRIGRRTWIGARQGVRTLGQFRFEWTHCTEYELDGCMVCLYPESRCIVAYRNGRRVWGRQWVQDGRRSIVC